MRFVTIILALAVSIGWVILLNTPLGDKPALGKLLDPLNGFWANAEPVSAVPSVRLPEGAPGSVSVTLDQRLVPHIKAKDDEGLYYAQGYVHAYYRLWQMDMQTRAAAGRLSEVAGAKTFTIDRNQRRKGMIWAAENSLRAMEAEPRTKKILDAYTKGVNAYISSLSFRDYPLEYKLMGFEPEPWNNLKCALLLKYMADYLTGEVDDIAMTYLRDILSPQELDNLYPERIDGANPVIPSGTSFVPASKAVPKVPSGKLFAHFDTVRAKGKNTAVLESVAIRAASGIGSNNWAVTGSRTANGAAILCNDPHLGLNLPSLWYESQLTAPGINCYGVSIPGAPGIVIGFNDSISWGFTNNYRDVKDFYEIRSDDPRLYFFDGKEIPFNERYESIYIKGKESPFVDTVRFTIHGPLMYDEHFPEPSGSGKTLAMIWMAHRGTNELLSLYLVNRAGNYEGFVEGIRHFECPAQNFIYADRHGNIALWGQGRFINKWKDQGKYVMMGDISATLWGDTIPMNENPHVLNPPQQYLASANQVVTDNTYPYWYNGNFSEFRSWSINHFLNDTLKKNAAEMMALQNNNWSIPANRLLPVLLRYIPRDTTTQQLGSWNDSLAAGSRMAAMFQVWSYFLDKAIWDDDFRNIPAKLHPSLERTVQLIVQDSLSPYYDDKTTTAVEGLEEIARKSYRRALDSIRILERRNGSEWYKVKNTTVKHLAKLDAFSYDQLQTGGWGTAINAMKQDHGPSWRMVVEMDKEKVRAYCVYPGGQSGNPGSKYYATFLDYWVAGRYYEVSLKK
jgi:penicillin amidase